MKLFVPALTLLTVAALPAAGQQRQSDNSFTWSGKIAPGRWIRVVNLSGTITVGQANGDNVEVTATKRWRRGDPAVVRFETKKFGPGDESVVICALWGERSSCSEDDYRVRGETPLHHGLLLSGSLQYETWHVPALMPGKQANFTATFQIELRPHLKFR